MFEKLSKNIVFGYILLHAIHITRLRARTEKCRQLQNASRYMTAYLKAILGFLSCLIPISYFFVLQKQSITSKQHVALMEDNQIYMSSEQCEMTYYFFTFL